MKQIPTLGLVGYGLLLALLLLAAGAGVLLLAPWIGGVLTWSFVAILWCGFLYLALLLASLLWALRVARLQGALRLSGVMRLRRQLLWLYGILEPLLPKGLRRMSVQQALIGINNQLLDAAHLQVPGADILVLTPHCVQRSKCGIKVTGEENHCTQCGLCAVGDLKSLQERFGISVAIATGGTLARKILKAKRPKVVIAVACERDLVSGLRDAAALPVYGLYNQRPLGPCADTTFDKSALEVMIRRVLLII